jgi:hypothetical protein
MDERRASNLRAMKSPASIALLVASLCLLLLSFVFYDRPMTDNNQILSFLRGEQSVATH